MSRFCVKMAYKIYILCCGWGDLDVDDDLDVDVHYSSSRVFDTMEEVEQFLATEYRDKTKYQMSRSVDVLSRGELVRTIVID